MRKSSKTCYALIFAVLAAVTAAAADKMQEPKVEYSADMYVETEQGAFKSHVYHALGGKERREMDAGGKSQIMIVRSDKQLVWMLMPESQMYMESSMKEGKKEGRDVNDCKIDQKSSGSEKVNGVTAAKSRISMTCPDGLQYDGNMWVTKEGIMVKMDATAQNRESKSVRIKTDLKDLKIGKQDPALFEIPDGYKEMSMGGLMKGLTDLGTKKQGTKQETGTPRTGRDYTSRSGKGRDYTSQGRGYTAQPRENSNAEKIEDTLRKVKGFFKW